MGALMDVLMLAPDSKEVQRMEGKGTPHVAAAPENRAHGLGSPHLWAWGGLVAAMAERDNGGAKNQAILKAYLSVLEVQTDDRLR